MLIADVTDVTKRRIIAPAMPWKARSQRSNLKVTMMVPVTAKERLF